MGVCRSTCAHTSDLAYYDAWRTDQPIRSRRRSSLSVRRLTINKQASQRRHTKLWVCERGCCSIRWKLDYADFRLYSKYAEMSPYVVVQENSSGCTCVICKGLPEQFLQQVGAALQPPTTPSDTGDDEEEEEEEEEAGTPRADPAAGIQSQATPVYSLLPAA